MVAGFAHSHILRKIFTDTTPSGNIMSGGVVFWGELGERNIVEEYIMLLQRQ